LQLDIQYFDFDNDGIKESAFINAVNGIATSADYSNYWAFAINNQMASVGVSAYIPNENDVLTLNYIDGSIKDAFEWLIDKQQSNGMIGTNFFQSSFALTALSLANKNNVILPSNTLSNAINYELSQQQNDSGFGNDLYTAVALMALLSNGKTLNDLKVNNVTPLELLESHQLNDGGFKSGTNESDVDTTSWVAIAFKQAVNYLPSKNNLTPIDYLNSAQHSNGSFGYNTNDSIESIDFTEEAIIAYSNFASNSENASNAVNWLKSKQNANGCFDDGFRTALAFIALKNFDQSIANNAKTCLLSLQNPDGSFGRTTNKANALDTALAIIALSNESLPLTIADLNADSNTLIVGLNEIVKFTINIKNVSRVKAINVRVSLQGIPSSWIENEYNTSIAEIEPNEIKQAEIYVKIKELGNFNVSALIESDSMLSSINSKNSINVKAEEALLEATITATN